MFSYIHSIYVSMKIKSIKNKQTNKTGCRPCPESRAMD